MTGFDSSAGMLKLARRRLGDDAELVAADLGRPLPFPDDALDDVVASLVLHYLEDWTAPLAELRRVNHHPLSGAEQPDVFDFFVELELPTAQVEIAAADWAAALSRFPQR